jgi:hypothetical protein
LLAVWGQGSAQEQVEAVWKERQFSFAYRSSIAIYSCTSLEGRIANILHAIGARPDLQIRLANCRETTLPPGTPAIEYGNTRLPGGPAVERGSGNARETQLGTAISRPTDYEQFVNVLVRLKMPVEVTPEVAEELRKDKSRRELVSHVTGDPLPRFDDPIAFAAERRVVTLSRKTIGVEPIECELLDQISARGFRELGVRVVSKNFVCERGQVSLIAPELKVEALMFVAPGIGDDRQAPAGGGEKADPGEPAGSGGDSAGTAEPAGSDGESARPAGSDDDSAKPAEPAASEEKPATPAPEKPPE